MIKMKASNGTEIELEGEHADAMLDGIRSVVGSFAVIDRIDRGVETIRGHVEILPKIDARLGRIEALQRETKAELGSTHRAVRRVKGIVSTDETEGHPWDSLSRPNARMVTRAFQRFLEEPDADEMTVARGVWFETPGGYKRPVCLYNYIHDHGVALAARRSA